MTRGQRRTGLLVIAGLALLVVVVGIIAVPMIAQTIINADHLPEAVGSEVVMTKEQAELMDRGDGFPLWGPVFLLSVAALVVAIFVVALRWPEKRG
ncbi:hypothetical protein [Labedella endophytica]|uniref:Uncharacterized protein n=1 Tax=Labedella endophytica TaxID=1523160 RepID=A0A3S0VH58_9MICO|nr:hypothetical protein [Labedella endophytica]RUR01808.1 hypothetical protein ELQ94_10165 [Labedella endophytica]